MSEYSSALARCDECSEAEAFADTVDVRGRTLCHACAVQAGYCECPECGAWTAGGNPGSYCCECSIEREDLDLDFDDIT